MASQLATRLDKTVLRLITKFGSPQTYTHFVDRNRSTPENHTVTMTPPQFTRNADGELNEDEMAASFIAAKGLPFVPEIGDEVTYLGSAYQVHNLKTVDAGGLVVAYRVGLVQ